MADLPANAPANGAVRSQIFDPAARQARPPAPPRTPSGDEPAAHSPVERDPTNGRFLRPGIPGSLVSRARRVGLTDDDLRDVEDAAELRDLVRDREFDAKLERVFDPKVIGAALAARERPIEEPTARPPLDLGLNDEEDSPRLIEALGKLRDHYEGRIGDLQKTVDELKGKHASREAREGQAVDRAFERAFAAHPQVFGKGAGKDVTATKMGIRRAAAAFWNETGGDPDGIADAVNGFVKDELGGGRKPARRQPADEVEDDDEADDGDDEAGRWERGVLNRPSQAGSREAAAGYGKAVQGVKRRLAGTQASDARAPRGIYLPSRRTSQGQ